MLQGVSTLTYSLLLAGFLLRRRRGAHMPVMGMAMGVDLALVIWIEWTRAAVERVVAGPGPLILFHAAVSTVVVLLYVGMALLGNRLRQGGERWRLWHQRAGWMTVACRTANYATSWMI